MEILTQIFSRKLKRENEELKKELETLKKLVIFDLSKVFALKEGKVFIGDYEITDKLKKVLKEESAYIKNTELWKIMRNTLIKITHEVMFEKSKDFEDMRTGKAMLYNLDIQQKLLEKINEF